MRLTRSAMLNALDSEYVKMARIKGLAEWKVVCKHALKNAAIPPLTYFGIILGTMVTGSVTIETIFAWPGLGRLAVRAVLEEPGHRERGHPRPRGNIRHRATHGHMVAYGSAMASVLVVEDDAHSKRIFRDALEHFGFEVEVAASAEEALVRLREFRPSVLIVDIRLPGLSGWDLIRRLRADERFESLRIVAVSVYDADNEQIQATRPDRYLNKPIDPRVLKSVVEDLLASPGASAI
jgi:CheY-like chemotaxis protein